MHKHHKIVIGRNAQFKYWVILINSYFWVVIVVQILEWNWQGMESRQSTTVLLTGTCRKSCLAILHMEVPRIGNLKLTVQKLTRFHEDSQKLESIWFILKEMLLRDLSFKIDYFMKLRQKGNLVWQEKLFMKSVVLNDNFLNDGHVFY